MSKKTYSKEKSLDKNNNPNLVPRILLPIEDLEMSEGRVVLDLITASLQQQEFIKEDSSLLMTGTDQPRLEQAIKDGIVFAATPDQIIELEDQGSGNSPFASARNETDLDQNPLIVVWDAEKLSQMSYSERQVNGNPDMAYEPLEGATIQDALVAVMEFIPESDIVKHVATVGKVAILS